LQRSWVVAAALVVSATPSAGTAPSATSHMKPATTATPAAQAQQGNEAADRFKAPRR
jgi:hypothetical protein